MTPVVVTGRHRPHEVWFLAFSAAIGVAFVAGIGPPGTVEQLMPGWVIWTWYVLLLISGVTGLASLVLRYPYQALVLERAAMWGQAAAPALYGLALLRFGHTALFAVGFCVAWSAASVWRMVQISQELRLIRRAGEEL